MDGEVCQPSEPSGQSAAHGCWGSSQRREAGRQSATQPPHVGYIGLQCCGVSVLLPQPALHHKVCFWRKSSSLDTFSSHLPGRLSGSVREAEIPGDNALPPLGQKNMSTAVTRTLPAPGTQHDCSELEGPIGAADQTLPDQWRKSIVLQNKKKKRMSAGWLYKFNQMKSPFSEIHK